MESNLFVLKTRKLFVLRGKESDIDIVLGSLQFKGLTEFPASHEVTLFDIGKEFDNNKSIACFKLSHSVSLDFIEINVVNSAKNDKSVFENCINLMDGNLPKKFQAIADKYDCDIGDHKSNSSGLNGTPSRKDCPYCIYLNDNHFDTAWDIHRTVYKSSNFFVMPTVGEFIKGYLLIIPNEHVMSMAELSPDLNQEFLDVLDDVITILKLTYPVNHFLVWENGTGNGGIGKAKSSIVHSHVHVAPSKLGINAIEFISGFPFTRVSYDNLSSYGKHSYLLIKGFRENEWWINDNPDLYIPRQYVRQLIAAEYGLSGDSWNWRTNPFINLIESTCKDIQNALIQNWTSLPPRIKENTKNYLLY